MFSSGKIGLRLILSLAELKESHVDLRLEHERTHEEREISGRKRHFEILVVVNLVSHRSSSHSTAKRVLTRPDRRLNRGRSRPRGMALSRNQAEQLLPERVRGV